MWLGTVLAMVFGMVVLGGVTRLTGSGLSMVDWRPLMGSIPPIGVEEWQRVFQQYQQSPEYLLVNQGMDLEGFKRIFMFEYLHRLLGRSIGLVFLVGWIYLGIRKRLDRRLAIRSGIAFLLGGLQGVLGWVMVKSGLIDVPEVSHFRLAAHLCLAFGVGLWLWWIIFDEVAPTGDDLLAKRRIALRRASIGFMALVTLQVIYGAFMAGTKAGWMFSSFPDMNGAYSPAPFFTGESVLHDLIHAPAAIHWVHRALAWLAAGYGLGLWFAVRRAQPGPRLRLASRLIVGLLAVQVVLGVLTVVYAVPISLAVAHQGCAFFLLSATLLLVHQLRATD